MKVRLVVVVIVVPSFEAGISRSPGFLLFLAVDCPDLDLSEAG
jgi:hypothetical protein